VAPAQRFDDRPWLAVSKIEPIVAAIGVGLQNAAPARQMAFGMFAGAIARGVEQRRRRVRSAERLIVTDINPDPAGFRLALGEDGNRGVVAVQPLGGQNVPFD
jgi:hypothetical protein